jgi:hypothetical protein
MQGSPVSHQSQALATTRSGGPCSLPRVAAALPPTLPLLLSLLASLSGRPFTEGGATAGDTVCLRCFRPALDGGGGGGVEVFSIDLGEK